MAPPRSGGTRPARLSLVSAALFLAATFVRGFLTMIANYQAEWVSQKVAYRYRLDFFAKLQSLSFEAFTIRSYLGDLIDVPAACSTLGCSSLHPESGMMTSLTLVLLLGFLDRRWYLPTPTAAPVSPAVRTPSSAQRQRLEQETTRAPGRRRSARRRAQYSDREASDEVIILFWMASPRVIRSTPAI